MKSFTSATNYSIFLFVCSFRKRKKKQICRDVEAQELQETCRISFIANQTLLSRAEVQINKI